MMVSKRIRDDAISYFKKYHGNHSHDVAVTLDVISLCNTVQEWIDRGRLSEDRLGYYGLTLVNGKVVAKRVIDGEAGK